MTKFWPQKMLKNSSKVGSYSRFDLKFGILVKYAETVWKLSKSSYGDPFRDQKVFKNEGVNQGSNFPGPTPKTKVAPNPIFQENIV